MSCYHPHYALDLGLNPDTGKRKIKFLAQRHDDNLLSLRYKYGEDSVLCLPCGHCVGCCLDYAKEWAVRCVCESLTYPDYQCWFITLTYAPNCVPDVLSKEPLRKFIKTLRNKKYKIRFFGCGERGSEEKTFRPHFHVLIFGLPLTDLKLWKKTRNGYLFTSKLISEIWPYGFSTVAHCTFETAGYIARYCMKKRMHQRGKDEFIIMSKRPGLGEKYFKEHADEILKYDHVTGKFGNSYYSSCPRYFDKLAEKFGLNIDEIKENRLERAKKLTRSQLLNHCYVHEEELNLSKEMVINEKSNLLRRSM